MHEKQRSKAKSLYRCIAVYLVQISDISDNVIILITSPQTWAMKAVQQETKSCWWCPATQVVPFTPAETGRAAWAAAAFAASFASCWISLMSCLAMSTTRNLPKHSVKGLNVWSNRTSLNHPSTANCSDVLLQDSRVRNMQLSIQHPRPWVSPMHVESLDVDMSDSVTLT